MPDGKLLLAELRLQVTSLLLGMIPLSSQSRAARQLMDRIQSHSMEARLDAMKELAKLSADVTFATEFINMEGITVLTRLVESGTKLLSQ